LHLLAKLLDPGLQRQPDARQIEIGRFRAQRVGLAVQFLAEKIQPAADCLSQACRRRSFARALRRPVTVDSICCDVKLVESSSR